MCSAIKEQTRHTIWVSAEQRIVTFREVDGYEERSFPSQEEKLAYVYCLCEDGYRIL